MFTFDIEAVRKGLGKITNYLFADGKYINSQWESSLSLYLRAAAIQTPFIQEIYNEKKNLWAFYIVTKQFVVNNYTSIVNDTQIIEVKVKDFSKSKLQSKLVL